MNRTGVYKSLDTGRLFLCLLSLFVLVAAIPESGYSFSGGQYSGLRANAATLSNSEWVPMVVFTVGQDEFLDSVTVTLERMPGTEAEAAFHPAYIAEVAIFRDTVSNGVFNVPGRGLSDNLFASRKVPQIDEPGPVTLTLPSEGAGLGIVYSDPAVLPNTYYICVRTSLIFNNCSFRMVTSLPRNIGTVRTSPITCVDNVEDWIPTHDWNWNRPVRPDGDEYPRKLGTEGLAKGPWLQRLAKELDFYPGYFPHFRPVHPDAQAILGDLESPQLIQINSDEPYPLFGIELGYFDELNDTHLQEVKFRMISNGQLKDLIGDGIDNDLDGVVDDPFVRNLRLPNRNDDLDSWVEVNNNGVFDPGIDAVILDITGNGICEVTDEILFGGKGDDDFNAQMVGLNDDNDVWAKDPARNSASDEFIALVDQIFVEASGLNNIYPNNEGHYDGTSFDGSQIGDEILFHGLSQYVDADGELTTHLAEDDGDFWTGPYSATRDSFNSNLSNGYNLQASDPVAVFLDSGDIPNQLDSEDYLISFPGSAHSPKRLDNVNNLANRFLLSKRINVRGLNDDYLYKHPRTDAMMEEFFKNNPGVFDIYDELVKANPYLTMLQWDEESGEVFERFMLDATDYFRIPIGDFILGSGDDATIWADMDGDGAITPMDASPEATFNSRGARLVPMPPPGADLQENFPDGQTVPYIDEENYNGADDDGDGYIDEDSTNFQLFVLIDEDEYDFFVDFNGDGLFDPLTEPYYVDANADGMYQPNEWNEVESVTNELILGMAYLTAPGIHRLDNDFDGFYNEDPRRWLGNDPERELKRYDGELIDEDGSDGIDNDGDGVIDEDSWWVPCFPLVDEERLDYFVDEPGGKAGVYDDGLDEYYIDLNANGVYDPAVRGDIDLGRREDECLYKGADGKVSMNPGDPYINGTDNDMDGLINEDVRDSNLQPYDFEANRTGAINDGFQVWADTNGDGTFSTGDTQISDRFSITPVVPEGVPAGSLYDNSYNNDFIVTIPVLQNANSLIPTTDDGQFDFFVTIRTDGGEYDGNSVVTDVKIKETSGFGMDWGDDFSAHLVSNNIKVEHGKSLSQELTARQAAGYRAEDLMGYHSGPGILVEEEEEVYWQGDKGRVYNGLPYIDATSGALQVIGINVCTSSASFNSDLVIDSIRVNFVNEDLEGDGVFEITDLLPLSSNENSGVMIYKDVKGVGDAGSFDRGDTYVPLSSTMLEWDPDGEYDPIVRNGGHYVVLKPTKGLEIPSDDFHASDGSTGNWGYDYFIVVRTSDTIDYNDGFRMFIRDGDVKFSNGKSAINTSIDADSIAANVPTVLSNLQEEDPGEDFVRIVANSKSTAAIGLDMHDSNRTFDGKPSKLEAIRINFHNVDNDTDFTSTDIAPMLPLDKQWVNIDPLSGQTQPYRFGMGKDVRVGSVNGVTLYRDAPNSDTEGIFDDPFDLNVVNPDTPVLLSGLEDWDFLIGWHYNISLVLDPPDFTNSGEDISPVDPFDPEPYETLPESDEFGDNFFVVIRTSDTISYGDDFYVSIRPNHEMGWVFQPLFFWPPLLNSIQHPWPQTRPFASNRSFESVVTSVFKCPTITITNFHTSITQGSRQDATSDAFPIFGLDFYSDVGETTDTFETVNAIRMQVRNIGGFDPRVDLNPVLSMGDGGQSGLGLWVDNGNGYWDINDASVEIKDTNWEVVFFADSPGKDGVLGTSDDPGTIGIYDEGVDELFLDDGYLPGFLDISDTVISDGQDNKLQSIPSDSEVNIPLHNLPKGSERWSVLFIPTIPINVPVAYDGGMPDVFLTARTSENIDFLDKYRFEISRDAITFSTGKSKGNLDLQTPPVDTNVPTHLIDISRSFEYGLDGILRRADEPYPVFAVNMVNDTTYESYVTSMKLIFNSLDDTHFEPNYDLKPVLPSLVDGELLSGVSFYRDMDGDGMFDIEEDMFVELTGKPTWTSLGNGKYEIVLRFNHTGQEDILAVPKDKDRLETGEIFPDFFLLLMPSFLSTQGDDFTVEIPPHGIKFRENGIDSGESITSMPLMIYVNAPPTITLSQPPSRKEYEPEITELVGRETFTIQWRDSDNDDNASVNLFYYPADSGNEGNWELINTDGPIPENDNTDSYIWTVGNVRSGDYRIVATINDGFNPMVEDHSGIVRIVNIAPTISITRPGPGTHTGTSEDYFTIRWLDSDPDNDAMIDLYITPEVFDVTYELTAQDIENATKVAENLSEDLNGNVGSYNLSLIDLLEEGLLEFEVPQTVIATIDDNVPPHPAGIVDYATFSLGTFEYERELYLRIIEPTGENIVRDTFEILWEAASSGGRDATVTLRYSPTNFGFDNDVQIPGGVPEDEFDEDSLIIEASYKILDGSYVWDIVDFDGRELSSIIPSGTNYYIYGQLTSVSDEIVGNFSGGTLLVRDNLFNLLTPFQPKTIARNSFVIQWEYYTDKTPANVDLYFDTDSEPGGGVLFARDLRANNGYPGESNRGRFEWDISELPSGEYWVYGNFNDQYPEPVLSTAPGSLLVSTIIPSKLFMLDGYGQFHFDGPNFVSGYPLNFGWDVMRSVKADPDSDGFYMLDAFGGIYTFGDVAELGSMYFYQDGVKDIELVGENGYYVLNGYGLVDYRGDAEFFGDPPFTGEERYVDIEPTRTGQGYYILDIDGAVHTFGDAQIFNVPLLTDSEAVDIELTEDGTGMLMLDSQGQIYPIGSARSHGSIRFSEPVASDLIMTGNNKGYVVMDDYGLTYSFGLASDVRFVTEPLAMPIANDMEYARAELQTPRTVITEIWDENIIPAVSSDWIIWSSTSPGATTAKDLYSYHIPTGATYNLVFQNGDQVNPSISGDTVVYTSLQNQKKQIYSVVVSATDVPALPVLVSDEVSQQEQPDISKNIVVYSAYKPEVNTWDIVMRGLDLNIPFNLTPNTDISSERAPSVEAFPDGAPNTVFVAYESWKNGQSDLYLWTGQSNGQGTTRLIRSGTGDQYQPQLRYPWLVYTNEVNRAYNVRMYSLVTGEDIAVTNTNLVQWSPVLGTNYVSWVDKRFDVWDVFMMDFLGTERKMTTGYQIVRALSSSEKNLVWVEYNGERWQLVLNRVGFSNMQPPSGIITATTAKE